MLYKVEDKDQDLEGTYLESKKPKLKSFINIERITQKYEFYYFYDINRQKNSQKSGTDIEESKVETDSKITNKTDINAVRRPK